jgi:NhaA family Na+:H+ antiporter
MEDRIRISEKSPFKHILRPFEEFVRAEASGGILMLLCTIAALMWANSPWGSTYTSSWQTKFTIGLGDFVLEKSLLMWINNGLMVVFFLVIGLEIKREILVGELSSPREAALPIIAALGGMLTPAAIYTVFNAGTPGARGWGIPMATACDRCGTQSLLPQQWAAFLRSTRRRQRRGF